MVNQWGSGYNDNNEPPQNYGDGSTVLSNYDFSNFNKNSSFWIVALNALFITFLTYIAMRPQTSQLLKVDDADLTSEANAIDNGKKKQNKKRGLLGPRTYSNLEESLLSKEDLALEHSETFGPRLTYDVAWYRQSTGQIQMSRGCRLVFRNLTYSVPSKTDKTTKLTLLKGVSGRAHPGEMYDAFLMYVNGLMEYPQVCVNGSLRCRQIDSLGHPR